MISSNEVGQSQESYNNQRVKDCGESECQQDESSEKEITRWIELDNSLAKIFKEHIQ
jgi:hypothetical protein